MMKPKPSYKRSNRGKFFFLLVLVGGTSLILSALVYAKMKANDFMSPGVQEQVPVKRNDCGFQKAAILFWTFFPIGIDKKR